MSEDGSRRWMTYAELAAALGLPSAKAGESRARRAKWERQIGNDGFARVAVPLSVLSDPAPSRRPYDPPPKATQTAPVLAELKAAHEALVAEALRRANTAEARLAEAERQLAEMPALREAIGVAKGEAAALREALARETRRAEQTEALAQQGQHAAGTRLIALETERRRLQAQLEADAKGQQEALERERILAAGERATRQAAEAAREAADRELAEWTTGGPVARAWRAFLSRRGRP